MQEEYETSKWLVSVLEPATGLQTYMDLIPQGIELPAIRITVTERQDVRGIGDNRERIMTQLDWLIAIIREGHGIAALIPMVNALDTALQNANGVTDTVRVLSCVRLEPFNMLEPEDSGVQYRHAGGIYRTMTQPL